MWNNIVDFILRWAEENSIKIEYLYRGGSMAWDCPNPHDIDVIGYTETACSSKYWHQVLHIDGVSVDFWLYNPRYKQQTYGTYLWAKIMASQPGHKNLLYGHLPNLDWKDYRKDIFRASYERLVTCIKNIFLDSKHHDKPKTLYHIWISYYLEINHSLELTDDQKKKVGAIHDRQLTLEDCLEMRTNIENILLKEGWFKKDQNSL